MNLTAITDPEGIAVKHFLDSMTVFKFAEIKQNSRVIDVGTAPVSGTGHEDSKTRS